MEAWESFRGMLIEQIKKESALHPPPSIYTISADVTAWIFTIAI
jgi:hypothetical protein